MNLPQLPPIHINPRLTNPVDSTLILEKAEVMAFLEDYQSASLLLSELPLPEQRGVRAVAVRFNIWRGLQKWKLGQDLASRVRPTDHIIVRQAAGRFLMGRAQAYLDKGRHAAARETLQTIQNIWPEGNESVVSSPLFQRVAEHFNFHKEASMTAA